MSKTVQEIMETMGKTVEASVALTRKSGSSYYHIADITSEDINEARYYFDGALYCSVMRCLELKLKGNWTTTAKKGLLLDGFNIKVTHPEGDSATIFYGGFYIAEAPEYDAAQNLTSIIAYDELYPSMQAYTTSLWKSGITVKNYLIAILDKLGINYDTNSLSLMANADNVITSEKFLDIENDSTEAAYTYRDILDEIARASGVTFAFKSSAGGNNPYKLYAIKPTKSGYVIDESNLRSVTIGAKYGPVKGVVLSREPQEDNVKYPSTLSSSQTAVKIANIEIMEDESNDAYRETFIQGIYSNVLNTEYYLYDLESFGIGFLNFGDIFTIKASDRENGTIGTEKSYETIFMRTDMTIGSGIKEKSKLEAPQTTSTDYAAASTTDKALKKTMLKVDKQNQRITALVKESDSKYSELQQTVNGFDAKIVDAENNLKAEIKATAESIEATYAKTETVKGQIDGVTNQISSLSSQISDIDDQLTGLDDTIANKVTTEVQKDTTIAILAGKVESNISGKYVTKSSYEDDKADWVLKTDYTSQIKQTDQEIAAAVNRVSTLEKAGYITEATCNSLIDAQADKITLAVESNLKIGARNILLDSACFKSAIQNDQFLADTSTVSHGTDSRTPSGEFKRIAMKKSGNYGGVMFKQEDILGQEENAITKIKANTTYTLSFWAKAADGTSTFSLLKLSRIPVFTVTQVTYDESRCNYVKDSDGYIALSNTEWRRIVLVFTTSAEYNEDTNAFCLWFSPSSTSQVSLEISSLKLEEGNIATDWTPSENDLVSDETYQSFIKLLPTEITAGVSSTVTDQYIADKIHSKCVSVTLDISGLTVENGALTLKDESGDVMIDSSGIQSEYLNFGKMIDLDTIKNGSYFSTIPYGTAETKDIDIWTLRNYTGTDTGINNAKAAVNIITNIPELKNLFWNNSNNWFCSYGASSTDTNLVCVAKLDEVDAAQTYILTYDIILASTANGKGLIPQAVFLRTDKSVQYDVGIDTLTSGTAIVSSKTYQYRYGTLSCSIRGYDLIKKYGGRSEEAVINIQIRSLGDYGTTKDSISWLYAMQSPNAAYMGFIGNIKLKTFVGATLNARALLNSNTDYFFDLGTGILSTDEIGCANLRATALPSVLSATDNLKPVYVDEETGQLYRLA